MDYRDNNSNIANHASRVLNTNRPKLNVEQRYVFDSITTERSTSIYFHNSKFKIFDF
jgi:hypothetical protein